jgi:hypothetical protein
MWVVGEILFAFACWDLDGDMIGGDGVEKSVFL